MDQPESYREGTTSILMDSVASNGSADLNGPSPGFRRRNRNPNSEGQKSNASTEDDDLDSIIRRMPSKKNPGSEAKRPATVRGKRKRTNSGGYATVRLKHGQAVNLQELADQLADQEEDTVDGEERLNENIRDMATTLSNKKAIRQQIERKRTPQEHTYQSCFQCKRSWRRLKASLAEVAYSLRLWKGHLKAIEGHFGTGVTSYFHFLKRLLLLNVPVFIITLGFVIVPQVLYRWRQQQPPGYIQNVSFTGRELVTGGGWFEQTEMYYGYYFEGVIEVISGAEYDMKYAYLCTCGGYYLLTVIILATTLSQSYKKNYISASSEFNFYYVSKVFCGWDYSVTSPKAATLKHKSLFKELQEFLSTFKEDDDRTCCQWCGILFLRLFTNLVVLGLLAGSGYLVWYISVTQSLSNDLDVLSVLAMPLCISAINLIVPFAFSILGSFERYQNPRTELTFTMVRTIILNGVTLGVLIYFWFNSVDCSARDSRDQQWLDTDIPCHQCWEDFMGMQIYCLVIVDFVFILLITLVSEFIRRLMSQFCCHSLGYPEFNIARNTLNLIYSQALVWLGTFYSPMLSFIMIVKVIIIFYVKRVSVVQNCMPSVKPWRAGQTSTLIQGLLFLAFLLCFVSVAYGVVFLKPSEVCGPYQGYNHTYSIIGDLLDHWQTTGAGTVIKAIIEIITSTAFLAFLVIALLVVCYYCKTISSCQEAMVVLLRSQITLEGKDRAFLLRLLQEASKRAAMKPPLPLTSQSSVTPDPGAMPVPESGKQFSKAKVAASSSLIPGGGKRSKVSPGSGFSHLYSPDRSSGPYGQTPTTHANPAFMAQSLDRDNDDPTPGQSNPLPSESDALNPSFVDTSPQNKPKLPYPHKQYTYK